MDNIIKIIKEVVPHQDGDTLYLTGSYLFESTVENDIDIKVFNDRGINGTESFETGSLKFDVQYHGRQSPEDLFGTRDNRKGWSRHNFILPVYNITDDELWEGDQEDVKARIELKNRLVKS